MAVPAAAAVARGSTAARAGTASKAATSSTPAAARSTPAPAPARSTPAPAAAATPASSGPRSRGGGRSIGSRAQGAVNDGAGFLLGLGLYALLANYLRGGMPQVKGWLKAKFINKPYIGRAGRTADLPGPGKRQAPVPKGPG